MIISLNKQQNSNVKFNKNAYITVEASFIFPLVIFMLVAVVQLSMKVHDHTVQAIAKEYGEVKISMAKKCYYDFESEHIDIKSVINKPLAGDNSVFILKQEKWLEERLSNFSMGRIIVQNNSENIDAYGQNSADGNLKNSSIVRWSQIIMDRGGLFGND